LASERVTHQSAAAKRNVAGMVKLRAWLQASRPLAQANVAIPLLFGQALALDVCGTFACRPLLVAFAFGVAVQLFIVYANDAADWESDAKNETFNRYSGGSRVVPEGKLTADELLVGAAVAVGVMLLLAIWAWLALGRAWLIVIIALSALLTWAYSFRPIRLSYRGHGEWLQAIGVGVVLPIAGFYLQCGDIDRLSWLTMAPSFVLGWAGNLTTALPDTSSDAATGKRTYAVRRGERAARRDSLVGIALAALGTPLVLRSAPWLVIAIVAALPLGVLAMNLKGLPNADARNRAACTRFVTLNGAAITLALLGWSLALVLRSY
jgi:1,4-dihydroxy-2-naphthoate octaprenyltransferase